MRKDDRTASQLRPFRFVPNFTKNADGSVLIECGNTMVLCTVNVEDSLPGWLRHTKPARGWLTAEYSMLPGSTHSRSKRERNHTNGRSQEIQRLIGRSLRGVMDFRKCPDMTFVVDCDVLQADGGTRTSAITGAWVALKIAVDKLLRQGRLRQNPLTGSVAAISVGVFEDQQLVDLDYHEDSRAELDMNVVLTDSRKILEVQGTSEGSGVEKEDMLQLIDTAAEAIVPLFDLQQAAVEGQEVEG